MAARKTTTSKTKTSKAKSTPKRREVGAVVCLMLACFSLLGYFTTDGIFIAFVGKQLRGLIGAGYYLAVPALLAATIILAFHKGRPVRLRVFCAVMVPVLAGALIHLITNKGTYSEFPKMFGELYYESVADPSAAGGAVSGVLAIGFGVLFSKIGAGIVFAVLALVCVFAAIALRPSTAAEKWRARERLEYEQVAITEKPLRQSAAAGINSRTAKPPVNLPLGKPKGRGVVDIPLSDDRLPSRKLNEDDDIPFPMDDTPSKAGRADSVSNDGLSSVQDNLPPLETVKASKKLTEKEVADAGFEVAEAIANRQENLDDSDYIFPPLSLLTPPSGTISDGRDEMAINTKRLDEALRSFRIDAEIVNVTRGPSVTRYEIELEQGVKLNKLTNLADDIALSLGATGVRVAPIPDKISTVGVEVPNKLVTTVYLREIIESSEFQRGGSKLTFAIGKDISGNAIVGDIARFPHLLIAGTTGSGKSVCMNSLILSLLYKSAPSDVKLIMIDPKMVELGIYNGIPHLLMPVVTDPKQAAGALQWGMYEMMKRYKSFSEVGAQNLAAYNAIMAKTEGGQQMWQIVVLIDELADLMLVAAKDVEESICRIAQMGRASGIHLIIATQRPSADVITGLMKANIPSRIAFAVDSALNSRIILDTMGAEKLVGKGDMLFAPLGMGKPMRVQGTFVTDAEREDVIEYVKVRGGGAQYDEDVMSEIDDRMSRSKGKADSVSSAPSSLGDLNASDGDGLKDSSGGSLDEMYNAAVEVLLETGQASVSMLQRRLKLGYGRAARIMDDMEANGVVGPFDGAKPRKLLITRDEWEDMLGG
ncbi:MAG: DNA translocase FtsK [Oscillospiraceae bacterium]|jgi:S-DNA-T family DNA segregation ATPase FtsK/SpoIIIE|nr:DNA translocase FtsK [Oscillospiraceae bacterium]